MKDTEGLWLRETWKRKGALECLHPELSPERSFSGVVTGAYICTTCGYLMAMERVPHEVTPTAHHVSPWKRHKAKAGSEAE